MTQYNRMEYLRVFDEINVYLGIQIEEIEERTVWNPMQKKNMFKLFWVPGLKPRLEKLENSHFWDPVNQEIKFNMLGRLLEDLDGSDDVFDGMEDFQMYKILCFVTDYEKKQLKNLVHLRDMYASKCKLSMLCTSTKHYGIPFETIMTQSLPYITTEEYDDLVGSTTYTKTLYGFIRNENFDCNRFDGKAFYKDGKDYYVKINIAIHIQEAMIDNIENGPKLIFEDKLHYDEKFLKDIYDDMDYKKIEIMLNNNMLSLGL